MATYKMTLVHQTPLNVGNTSSPKRGREMANILQTLATSAASGTMKTSAFDLFVSSEDPKFAYGVGVLDTVADDVGFTINGVTVVAPTTTDDLTTAGLVVAAINASTNALVQYCVRATNMAATFTVGTMAANASVRVMDREILAVSRAVQTGERGVFQWVGTAATDATALAAAINGHPGLFGRVVAYAATDVVYVFAINNTAPAGTQPTFTNSATITTSAFAARTSVAVVAVSSGRLGNCQTFAASGTGVTVSTGARLVGGTGVTGTTYSDSV